MQHEKDSKLMECEAQMKKSTVMTEGSIWKKILYFSIPLILGNLFQQLYNTVDSIIAVSYTHLTLPTILLV